MQGQIKGRHLREHIREEHGGRHCLQQIRGFNALQSQQCAVHHQVWCGIDQNWCEPQEQVQRAVVALRHRVSQVLHRVLHQRPEVLPAVRCQDGQAAQHRQGRREIRRMLIHVGTVQNYAVRQQRQHQPHKNIVARRGQAVRWVRCGARSRKPLAADADVVDPDELLQQRSQAPGPGAAVDCARGESSAEQLQGLPHTPRWEGLGGGQGLQ
mmetsp:Transcript_41397/g.108828  ORF Transcript_41397/g.108828 Transcript_41397/m.108828 type:complete len:211 (+) Transcript_41397:3838-4470(+)